MTLDTIVSDVHLRLTTCTMHQGLALTIAGVVAATLRDRTFKRGNVASIPVAAGLRSDKPTPHVDAYGGSLKWSQRDGQ